MRWNGPGFRRRGDPAGFDDGLFARCELQRALALLQAAAAQRMGPDLDRGAGLLLRLPLGPRLPDRGRLVPGAHADLMMFDPDTVGRGEKTRVSDLPAGAYRVDMPPTGVLGVWVNGKRVVDENGPIAGCGKPGQLVRSFSA